MPSQKQITTRTPVTSRDKGSSDSSTLQTIFNTSPVNTSDMEPEEVTARFEKLVLNGDVKDGYGFATFNRDYKGAPDYTEWEGAKGAPASAWVPNPSSPGEGSVNPLDKPSAPDGYGQEHSEGAYGGGPAVDPLAVKPSDASIKLSQHSVHGLAMGKSRFSE